MYVIDLEINVKLVARHMARTGRHTVKTLQVMADGYSRLVIDLLTVAIIYLYGCVTFAGDVLWDILLYGCRPI